MSVYYQTFVGDRKVWAALCYDCGKQVVHKGAMDEAPDIRRCQRCSGKRTIVFAKSVQVSRAKRSYIHTSGHVHVRVGSGYKFAHVLLAESVLGRPLTNLEVVHHINGDKRDNRNSNLLICDRKYHRELHHRMSLLYQRKHFGGGHSNE